MTLRYRASLMTLRRREYLVEQDSKHPDAQVYDRIAKAKANFKRVVTRALREFSREEKACISKFGFDIDTERAARDCALRRLEIEKLKTMAKAIDTFNAEMARIRQFARDNGVEDIVVIPADKKNVEF